MQIHSVQANNLAFRKMWFLISAGLEMEDCGRETRSTYLFEIFPD